MIQFKREVKYTAKEGINRMDMKKRQVRRVEYAKPKHQDWSQGGRAASLLYQKGRTAGWGISSFDAW